MKRGKLPALRVARRRGAGRRRSTLPRGGGERFVTFRFFLRAATEWAPAGHEVAWQQLRCSAARRSGRTRPRRARRQTTACSRPATCAPSSISTRACSASSRSAGGTCSPTARACSSGARRPTTTACRWCRRGAAASLPQLARARSRPARARARLGPGRAERRRARPPRRRACVTHRHRYRLLARGELAVENVVELAPKLRDVPRIGAGLALLPGLERLAWYGRGPWENYSDRLASTIVGRFESTVTRRVRAVHRPAGARPPLRGALAARSTDDARRRPRGARACRRSASAPATSPPPT